MPPWCLHKHHTEWHDITRFMDQVRVYLAACGGIRCEPLDDAS
jgi:hypothetical protein